MTESKPSGKRRVTPIAPKRKSSKSVKDKSETSSSTRSVLSHEKRQALIVAALDARDRAYAPYSRFQVGAALLCESGRIVSGCNVENASYGLTICAERNAVFAAVAAGERGFVAMALATAGGHFPCGACRQVLVEFREDLPLFIVDADAVALKPVSPKASSTRNASDSPSVEKTTSPFREVSLRDLLPGRFEFRPPEPTE